jgi:phosphate transport system permease protein
MSSAHTGAAGPRLNLKRQWTARRVGELAIKALLFAAAVISVVTTLAIVVSLIEETINFFEIIPFGDFAFGTEWDPLRSEQYGVLPLIFSTFYLTGIGLLVAIPLGLGSAIWLSEYASSRMRRIIKPILELLAGIPTIVLGYFALTWVTPTLLQDIVGVEAKSFNALSAGLVLGLLVLPTIASVGDDAMTSVPGSLREGAYGLGATKRQVALRVVFPAAISGIVAGIVLGASRAVGETVVILVAGGQLASLDWDPREPHQNMAAFIADTARSDVSTTSPEYLTIFAVGTTLFVICLILNMISIGFVRRYRQVYE